MVDRKRASVFGMLAGAIAMLLIVMVFAPDGLVSLVFWLPFMALVLGSIAGFFILRLDRTWKQLPESVVAALLEAEDAGVKPTRDVRLPDKKPVLQEKQAARPPPEKKESEASPKKDASEPTIAAEFARAITTKKPDVEKPAPPHEVPKTPPGQVTREQPVTPLTSPVAPPGVATENQAGIIPVKRGRVSKKVVFLIIEAYKDAGIKSFSLSRIRRDLGVNGEKNVEKLVEFLQYALEYDLIYKRGNKFTVL